MATVNCTIIGQKSRGGTTYDTSAVYLGHNGTYYEYCMAFTTGDFRGTSNSITFNIRLKNSAYANGTTRQFRYALLTSDENVQGSKTTTNFYYETTRDVEDPNQIAKGIVSFPDMRLDTDKVVSIDTDVLQPNTTYYLVLWPYQTNVFCTVSSIQYHGDISVDYTPISTVRIMYYKDYADGTNQIHLDTTVTVVTGEYFVPSYCSPPEGYDGGIDSTFNAYEAKDGGGWTKVSTGTLGVDGFYVTKDMLVQTHLLPYLTVYELHNMWKSDGTSYEYFRKEHTLKLGTTFTPSMITPPSTNTTEEVAFDAWNLDTNEEIVRYEDGYAPGDYDVTVSGTMRITVFYKALHTVTVRHYAMKVPSGYTLISTVEAKIVDGHEFTPSLVEPPSTNTTEEALFDVWNENGIKIYANLTPEVDFITVTGNFSIEVDYKPLHCITYDTNGRGDAPLTEYVVDGREITLPEMYNTKGYRFLGWSNDKSAKTGITGSYTPTKSVTLYAIWKKVGSYVRFEHNGNVLKCKVYHVEDDGSVKRCKVFYNNNGVIIKM